DNDVTRLQALVDKKKVVVTEASIKEVLQLDDAEGVDCLPNEAIFVELARMGYEKPSTKLTFYKAFFLSQWKFLIHTILQSMSAKRTSWNEFSSPMASAVICLSTEPSIPSPTPPTPPPQPPQDLPSTSKVQHTPPQSPQVQQPSSQPQAQQQATDFPMSLLQEALDACAALTKRVEHLEYDKVAQDLEIKNLKRRRVDTSDDTVMDDESNQGRMIDENKDDVVTLMDDKEEDKKDEEAKEDKPDEVHEVVDVVTTAKLITKVVTAASETVTAAIAAVPSRRRKGLVIGDPKEESTTSSIIPAETKSKDKGKGILVEEPKPLKKKQQTKEQMEEEESRALQSINETPSQKAAKRRKLNEEVEDLKRHLEIMPDKDDDVYTEALHLQESAAKQKLMLLDSAAERRLMMPSQVKTVNGKCCC
nr:hypothetical protein [Tanacetum cinerariifolium]